MDSKILEIFHNSEWGAVCYDAFDRTDATVACRQLGGVKYAYMQHYTLRYNNSSKK